MCFLKHNWIFVTHIALLDNLLLSIIYIITIGKETNSYQLFKDKTFIPQQKPFCEEFDSTHDSFSLYNFYSQFISPYMKDYILHDTYRNVRLLMTFHFHFPFEFVGKENFFQRRMRLMVLEFMYFLSFSLSLFLSLSLSFFLFLSFSLSLSLSLSFFSSLARTELPEIVKKGIG